MLSSLRTSESRKAEVVRFVITGGVATALQYGFYLLFVLVAHTSTELATVLSYGMSFVANFFMSNLFTFRTQPNTKKAATFTLSHIINLGMQTGLVAVFSRMVSPAWALLPAMAICVPCNFVLVRFALKSKHFQSKNQLR